MVATHIGVSRASCLHVGKISRKCDARNMVTILNGVLSKMIVFSAV